MAVLASPLGAVATPVVAPVVAPPVWVVTQFIAKEFDCGSFLGFAVEITNTLTGERRRNAIRVLDDPWPHSRAVEDRARAQLAAWATDYTGQCFLPCDL